MEYCVKIRTTKERKEQNLFTRDINCVLDFVEKLKNQRGTDIYYTVRVNKCFEVCSLDEKIIIELYPSDYDEYVSMHSHFLDFELALFNVIYGE